MVCKFLKLYALFLVALFLLSCGSQEAVNDKDTHSLTLPLPPSMIKAQEAGYIEVHVAAVNDRGEERSAILEIADGRATGTVMLKRGRWTIEVQFYQVAPSGNLLPIAYLPMGVQDVQGSGLELSYDVNDILFETPAAGDGIDPSISVPLTPSIALPEGCQSRYDCDGDGATNFDEIRAGTNPEDANSFPSCGNGQVELDEECDDGNAEDGDGCSASCENALYIVSFGTDATIQYGQGAELTWEVVNATSLVIDQDIGVLNSASGSLTVRPTKTTKYRLTATAGDVTEARDVTIHVNYAPSEPADIEAPDLRDGGGVFYWSYTNPLGDDGGCATVSFDLSVKKKKDGKDIFTKTNISGNSFDASNEQLEPRTDYEGEIVSHDNCGGSSAVSQFDFTTKDTGLLGWWRFDETSGTTATDSSGNGNDGTLNGDNGLPAWVGGISENALEFDQVDDFVEVSNHTDFNFGSGEFTASAWINSASIGADQYIIAKQDDAALNGFILYIHPDDGKNYVNFYEGGDGTVTRAPLVENGWSHVVGTRKGSKFSIYINGILRNFGTRESIQIDNNEPLVIGWGIDHHPNNPFHGLIDEVAIYDRALTTAEIRDNCQRNDPTGDTCAADDVPEQATPRHNLVTPPTRAFLSWEPGVTPPGKTIDHYQLCYVTDGSDLTPEGACLNPTYPTNPYFVLEGLTASNGGYRWKVRTCYDAARRDCSAYTPVWSFSTDDLLVGWWRFEGNLLDSSGNHFDGTPGGEGTLGFQSGNTSGQALVCDGHEYVNLPLIDGNLGFSKADNYSMETRYKTTGFQGNGITAAGTMIGLMIPAGAAPGAAVGLRNDGALGYSVTDSRDILEGHYSAGFLSTSPTYIDGSFHHVVGTYQGDPTLAAASLFIDGNLEGTGSAELFSFVATDFTEATICANGQFDYSVDPPDEDHPLNRFNGWIDEVALYKRTLAPEIVKNNFCAIEALAGTDPLPEVCR